jgi:hypothetical protein
MAVRNQYDHRYKGHLGAVNQRRANAGLDPYKNGDIIRTKNGHYSKLSMYPHGGPKRGSPVGHVESSTDWDIKQLKKQDKDRPKGDVLKAMYKNDPRFAGEAPTHKSSARMTRILTGRHAGNPRTTALGG